MLTAYYVIHDHENGDHHLPITFKEVIPMLSYMRSMKEPLTTGNKYFIIDIINQWKGTVKYKCFKIEEDTFNDPRWFQMDFIQHHNLKIGIL